MHRVVLNNSGGRVRVFSKHVFEVDRGSVPFGGTLKHPLTTNPVSEKNKVGPNWAHLETPLNYQPCIVKKNKGYF